MVEVAEGKRLDLQKQRFAQIARHTLAHLNGEDVVGNRKQGLQDRDDQHDDGRADHHLHVFRRDALIDDALDQAGNSQVDQDDGDQEDQGDQASLPVGPYEAQEAGDMFHVRRSILRGTGQPGPRHRVACPTLGRTPGGEIRNVRFDVPAAYSVQSGDDYREGWRDDGRSSLKLRPASWRTCEMNGAVIIGARLVDGDGAREGSLRIEGERIAELLPAGADAVAIAARHGAEVVDGRGRWLIPGGVDPHVHFALPTAGTVTCDDFASGTRAALAGGTTTVIDFVTPARGESLRAAVEARLREASSAVCDYSLHLSVTEWRAGMADELRDVSREFGLRSVKLYMAYLETIGLEDAALAAAMEACADLDLTVLLHAEDGAEVARRQRELLAAGQTTPAAHPRSRPPGVEERAVRRALALARETGCRLYVVHVSTGGGIAAIAAARAAGQVVFAETCPSIWSSTRASTTRRSTSPRPSS